MTPFETLLRDIRFCQICTVHLPHGPRPVVQADPSARILIAGQAPGRKVHDTGIPFNDPSGDRLRLWLGVTREQFYDPALFALVPMGFCYPGSGRGGDLPPRPECAPAWRAPLLAALPNIRMTLVLGAYAQAWHLKGRQAGSLTGTVQAWRDYWPTDLLPLPHPRNVRWFKTNPWFETEVIPHLQKRVHTLVA